MVTLVTTPDIEIVGEAVIFCEKVAVRVTCPEVITLSESSDVIVRVAVDDGIPFNAAKAPLVEKISVTPELKLLATDMTPRFPV